MQRMLAKEFETDMISLIEAINLKYDYDFRHYSYKSMKRTLVHAMDRMGCASLTEIQEVVLSDIERFYDLLQSITIPVSELFRDPTFFLALRENVIPQLKTYPSIKIWVAGCSTGEEVYSLAILLHEEDLLERATLYATDINPRSLARAEKGEMSLEALAQFDQNYQEAGGKGQLSDFYTAAGDKVIIKSVLRNKITFTDHSLVTDAVFAEMHLISCRNVLIYFDRELQDRTFRLFHESLCRKGFLGLGSKETLQFSKSAKDFDSLVKKDRIYQKK
jgi:chemotaxis protein methyltransferase CheR